ncbi:MAG: DUF2157 domain-containing protein [Pseudomonadota bacterium]
MTLPGKDAAQQRVDDIHAFRRELARLKEEGTPGLDDALCGALEARHRELLARYAQALDVDVDTRARQLSLGMRIASFLGALALAASVFFLFWQFWGGLGTAVQLLILIAAPVLLLVATLWVRDRDASGYFAKLVAMVAFTCFVLNVAMLGQIFNITPSDKALLPWAAFAFLLAYACDLRLLLATGILCVIAFVSARTGTWGGLYWLDFGMRPENFFPAALLIFAVPMVIDHRHRAGFAPVYRVFGLLALFLPVLVLANWGAASYLDIDRDVIEVMYQLLGFTGAAAVIWLGVKRGWNDTVNTGVVLFVIFLYTRLFDWWWDYMPKYLFFLVLGLVAVLLLLVLRRLRTLAGAVERAA